MWKRVLLVVLPIALILGGVAWYFNKSGDLPWQKAKHSVAPEKADSKTASDGKAKGPGWAVNCKSDVNDQALDCRLSQTVVMKESGRVLTQVTFLFHPRPKAPEVAIQLPLGVLLSQGATVRIDEETPRKLAFRTCDRGGCYAQGPLSPELIASLRKGNSLTVEFQDLANKTIRLPLSLDGFDVALGKVQRT